MVDPIYHICPRPLLVVRASTARTHFLEIGIFHCCTFYWMNSLKLPFHFFVFLLWNKMPREKESFKHTRNWNFLALFVGFPFFFFFFFTSRWQWNTYKSLISSLQSFRACVWFPWCDKNYTLPENVIGLLVICVRHIGI